MTKRLFILLLVVGNVILANNNHYIYQKFANYIYSIGRDLTTNSIVNMYEDNNEVLYLGTSDGLGLRVINDEGQYEFNMFQSNNLPQGGTPALVVNDSLIIVSGIQSIEISGNNYSQGTGTSFSLDNGDSWIFSWTFSFEGFP